MSYKEVTGEGMSANPASPKKIIVKYWPLIKGPQTGLLLATGLAGFMSARCPITDWQTLLGMTITLFLGISGSTIMNMWYDRDIDLRMKRTSKRPLPSGKVGATEALIIGCTLSTLSVLGALLLSPLYGLIIFSGLFFDVVVYTAWLKRRSSWSVVWGGIAGAMPVLAGRALGIGYIDWVGLLLGLSVLFWIPTHIMTFNMRYYQDYQTARIPTFPSVYGLRVTRRIIAASCLLAAVSMGIAALGIGISFGYLRVLMVISAGLLFLAVKSLAHPSEQIHFGLFKYASLYMLSAMLLVMLQAF
jgi:heme o synthase